MPSSILVLDANIIIRAVLGSKVRNFLIEYNQKVDFFAPDVCIDDAEEYLPVILSKKSIISGNTALEVLNHVKALLQMYPPNNPT